MLTLLAAAAWFWAGVFTGTSPIFKPDPNFGVSAEFYARKSSARAECERAVRNSLRAPATASFSGVGATDVRDAGVNGWIVDGWVDSQNGFGAMLRSNYRCSLMPVGSTAWLLKDVSVTPR